MSALVVYPPLRRFRPAGNNKPTVFLAGSIEMGKATEWQAKAILALTHASVIYNPRRLDWNNDWEQSIDCPEFNDQVNWELDMIEQADLVFFNFEADTKSPISLMELGGRTSNAVVCCPKGFWRKGNVDIYCDRNRISVFEDFEEAITKMNHVCYSFAQKHP